MIISFSKLTRVAYPFDIDYENLRFSGELTRKNETLAHCDGRLKGFCQTLCASCGDELEKDIDLAINLDLSDGVFKDINNELSDTMEFFGGNIDLLELARSELELYLSDCFYCEKCCTNDQESNKLF